MFSGASSAMDEEGSYANANSSSNVTLDDDDGDADAVVLAAAGLGLYALSLLTIVGNAMVLHAIRTEKSLQTVR